jgi:hypothetical protein
VNLILTTKAPRAPRFTKTFVPIFLDRCSVRRRRTRSKFSEKTKALRIPRPESRNYLFLFFQKIIEHLRGNNDPEKFGVLCVLVVKES